MSVKFKKPVPKIFRDKDGCRMEVGGSAKIPYISKRGYVNIRIDELKTDDKGRDLVIGRCFEKGTVHTGLCDEADRLWDKDVKHMRKPGLEFSRSPRSRR